MSWRRFCVLVSGLGPNTGLVAHLSSRRRGKGRHSGYDQPQVVIDADASPEAFDDFWRSMAGKDGKKNGRMH